MLLGREPIKPEALAGVDFRQRNGLHSDIAPYPFRANFSREPPFLLRGVSYKRELPPEGADSPGNELAPPMVAVPSRSDT
jgi:hypothetical protein